MRISFLFLPFFWLFIFFVGCKQVQPENCTITTEQFTQLAGAEDSVVRKILPLCFKVERRGDFREFTYYISVYNSGKTEYYDQYAITTARNNKSVYFTTSNPELYESYKSGILNLGFTKDSTEYSSDVYWNEKYELKLSELEPNGQKRYSIYLKR